MRQWRLVLTSHMSKQKEQAVIYDGTTERPVMTECKRQGLTWRVKVTPKSVVKIAVSSLSVPGWNWGSRYRFFLRYLTHRVWLSLYILVHTLSIQHQAGLNSQILTYGLKAD